VPQIATCVPREPRPAGPPNGGSTLINSAKQLYTFVVWESRSVLRPGHPEELGVWPTDVMFSVVRDGGASRRRPAFGCNNGWILAQALLSPGNGRGTTARVPHKHAINMVQLDGVERL